jgi:hypothetical protein
MGMNYFQLDVQERFYVKYKTNYSKINFASAFDKTKIFMVYSALRNVKFITKCKLGFLWNPDTYFLFIILPFFTLGRMVVIMTEICSEICKTVLF